MDFRIFDDNVSTTMNVFLVIGNIINLVYNIPQMVKTYKTKSTGDFSPTFLFLRVIGNTIWLAYSIELNTFLFLLSNIVSVFASIFICYYKVGELLKYITPAVLTTVVVVENVEYHNLIHEADNNIEDTDIDAADAAADSAAAPAIIELSEFSSHRYDGEQLESNV